MSKDPAITAELRLREIEEEISKWETDPSIFSDREIKSLREEQRFLWRKLDRIERMKKFGVKF